MFLNYEYVYMSLCGEVPMIADAHRGQKKALEFRCLSAA